MNYDPQNIASEILHYTQKNDYDSVITLCLRALQTISTRTHPRLWAFLQISLGEALRETAAGREEQIDYSILALTRALSVYSDQAFPDDWAYTMQQMARSYYAKHTGDRAENIERTIYFYNAALRVIHRETDPIMWSDIMNNLAIAYRDRYHGRRQDNIERTLYYCQQALTVLSKEEYPGSWSSTMNNLATAFRDRILGDRAENVEDAIHYYHQALSVRSPQADASAWRRTMQDLAHAYSQRIWGSPAENSETALVLYDQLLDQINKQSSLEYWIYIKHLYAIALVHRIKGNRTENIEAAIQCYREALESCNPQQMPTVWAEINFGLANLYHTRPSGNYAENLELAIEYYWMTLKIRVKEIWPTYWADVMNNLGNAYWERPTGDRAGNIETAIDCFRNTLSIRNLYETPIDWSDTMNNLGNALADRIRGDRSENIEEAIKCYKQALVVRSPKLNIILWAETNGNLAAIYQERILGDQADNVEKAIDIASNVLEMLPPNAPILTRAGLLEELGNAYRNRIRGREDENNERAGHAYNAALRLIDSDQYPLQWARLTMNRAIATSLRSKQKYPFPDMDEMALRSLQKAAAVLNKDVHPQMWGGIVYNIGLAYLNSISRNRGENTIQAIKHFEDALTVVDRTNNPELWANVMNGLATAALRSDSSTNLEIAASYLEEALNTERTAISVRDIQLFLSNLGIIYFRLHRWSSAEKSFEEAIELGEMFFGDAYSQEGSLSESYQLGGLYVRLSYCQIQMEKYHEALANAEKGHARVLVDKLAARNEVDFSGVDDERRENFLDLRAKMKKMESDLNFLRRRTMPDEKNERELLDQLSEAHVRLRNVVNEIRQSKPNFLNYKWRTEDIVQQIPEKGALIFPIISSEGSAVYVLSYDQSEMQAENIIHFPEFSISTLQSIIVGDAENIGWFEGYQDYHDTGDLQKWKDEIEQVTKRLWDSMVGKLHSSLITLGKKINRLLFVTQGSSLVLPWHAAWHYDEGEKKYLVDYFDVTYIPSFQTFYEGKKNLRTDYSNKSTVIGVSKYEDMASLPNVLTEVDLISQAVDPLTLIDEDATLPQVIARLPGSTYLHFASHATFSWQDPLKSSIHLFGNTKITLADILSTIDLSDTRLVTLSACNTGITDIRNAPYDFVGLPAGFMQAGVPGIVASLWPVSDRSTALMMSYLYKKLGDANIDDFSPAKALREAQKWLRNLTLEESERLLGIRNELAYSEHGNTDFDTDFESMFNDVRQSNPFSHSYYWAAFIFNGV